MSTQYTIKVEVRAHETDNGDEYVVREAEYGGGTSSGDRMEKIFETVCLDLKLKAGQKRG